ALDELRTQMGISVPHSTLHPPLSREEVAAFDESGLVEIGSHTLTHPLLTALPNDAQREEIVRGKAELESIVGHPVMSFAYPHGQYSDATVSLVQEAGFLCGCSTDAHILSSRSHPFRLPRVQATDCDADQFERWLRDWLER